MARHIDLVTRDFPEVEDFILQSLSTLENETDFRQMQLALRDLEVKSSSKQETLEWLESFC